MTGAAPSFPTEQSISLKISNLVVQLLHTYTGRGPTKARTYITDELVTVVLRDALTRGERSLLDDDHGELVIATRQAYQHTMRRELIAGVEELTGRKVLAFLSANNVDPDIAIESFVLQEAGEKAAETHRLRRHR